MTWAGFAKIEFVFELPKGFVVDAAIVAQTDRASSLQLK
jgi:hypothetical protein